MKIRDFGNHPWPHSRSTLIDVANVKSTFIVLKNDGSTQPHVGQVHGNSISDLYQSRETNLLHLLIFCTEKTTATEDKTGMEKLVLSNHLGLQVMTEIYPGSR